MMRVQKEWLEIIDENKALWRRLILPEPNLLRGWGGWNRSVVERFDRQSHSSITEVSMETELMDKEEAESMGRVLAKSKETLRIFRIQDVNYYSRKILRELSWKLPNLIDCRITDHDQDLVQFIQKNPNQVGGDQGCKLRILWSRAEEFPLPFPRQILTGLVSLSLESSFSPSEWKQVLNGISKETLKHLVLSIVELDTSEGVEGRSSPIELPNLEVLEIKQLGPIEKFPSWIKLGPSFSNLICHNSIYPFLPSVSTLWIRELGLVQRLMSRCPELVELRIMEARYLKTQHVRDLIWMLKQRKRNVEDGMEIEGGKMIQLKRLLIDISDVTSSDLQEMKDLVEEVLELSSAPLIEVEV